MHIYIVYLAYPCVCVRGGGGGGLLLYALLIYFKSVHNVKW